LDEVDDLGATRQREPPPRVLAQLCSGGQDRVALQREDLAVGDVGDALVRPRGLRHIGARARRVATPCCGRRPRRLAAPRRGRPLRDVHQADAGVGDRVRADLFAGDQVEHRRLRVHAPGGDGGRGALRAPQHAAGGGVERADAVAGGDDGVGAREH
jgi:hypothetical protein